MTKQTYITDEVKSYIGREGKEMISGPVTECEVRRFIQAIMDPDPIHWNEEYAKKTRYRGVVAPPLFVTHIFRTPAGAPDPLEEGFKKAPDFDGLTLVRVGIEAPPLPLKRTLNAGNEIEFFKYPRIGESVVAKGKIADIYEREGRSGKMVFIVNEAVFKNDKGELLLIARQTSLRR